jgi:hypothetical protein
MSRTEQQKTDETPVVSPLAHDKTYGERWYSGIFDWGLNYWANLLSSAGFSQWAEHGTRPVKFWGMKEAASPRKIQADLAKWINEKDPLMNDQVPFFKGFKEKMRAELPAAEATVAIAERCMARARSIVLLVPGFFVMIPAVWFGPKIKPWLVQTLNRMHYGEEAMDDPSLIARQQAIAAEERPTLLGTIIARFGTAFAAIATAQLVGSENNFVNKIGKKYNNKSLEKFGVNSFTESWGEKIGSAMPESIQSNYNSFSRKHGLDWSNEQIKLGKNKGLYSTATSDLGRFVVADTFYTMVTALTIQPIIRLLRMVPGMSYKPKIPKNSAVFEGEKIKVPANHYADVATEQEESYAPTPNEMPTLERTQATAIPSARVTQVEGHIPPSNHPTPQEELAAAR